jgi:hypothetical protein
MPKRSVGVAVPRAAEDDDGDIIALCNPDASWSPRFKASAISDIENDRHAYYVKSGETETDVHVVDGPTGKYLRTTADSTSDNNLDNLPDC